MQRQRNLVAAGLLDDGTTDAAPFVREQPSIVAALCTCVLGEREGSEPDAWPPRSIDELSGSATERQGPDVLAQGFYALDELALREMGWYFARLDRRAQLYSLFELEAGRGRLSRRRASAFMDAFLTLAAQAYFRDALEMFPGTSGR